MNEAQPLVRVRLLDLPVEVHRRASEHQEALRRELAFVEHAQAPDAAPARLQALTDEVNERYGGMTEAQNDQLTAAIEAGEERIDLDYQLPPDMVDATVRLGTLLDELDQFCRDGELLTLVTPAESVAYRAWYLGEFVAQIRDGREPQPWVAPADTADTPAPHEGDRGDQVWIAVHDDLDLATAPELRSQLVRHADAGATRITVDLSRCDFLDSTGISLLVTTHHRLVREGGGLRLHGATGQVRSILEMAVATKFFDQG